VLAIVTPSQTKESHSVDDADSHRVGRSEDDGATAGDSRRRRDSFVPRDPTGAVPPAPATVVEKMVANHGDATHTGETRPTALARVHHGMRDGGFLRVDRKNAGQELMPNSSLPFVARMTHRSA